MDSLNALYVGEDFLWRRPVEDTYKMSILTIRRSFVQFVKNTWKTKLPWNLTWEEVMEFIKNEQLYFDVLYLII